MKSFWNKLHKIGDLLHLPNIPNWLVVILALVFILRVPSFFEPYYYGDEMIYMTLGQGVRQGVSLYDSLHDNKPPLLYITAAISGNLFGFKVILAFINLITIVLFYRLTKIILNKNLKGQKIATVIFALLTTLPLLEGLTANSELFMIPLTILAFLILLNGNPDNKKIFLAGVFFGIGALFKIPAAFDVPVIIFYWLFTLGFGKWRLVLKNTFILMAGFAAPIFATFIWYFMKGFLPEYIKAAFMQNVGYLSSFRPGDVQKSFLVKNGPLLIRGGIVFAGLVLVFLYKKGLSKKFILLTFWILFSLFAVTLSERPYPHYLIQAVAPVSILLAVFFTEKSTEQSLVVLPLALTLFVPLYYKFWVYPTSTYYIRFIKFAVGREDKSLYFNSFSPNTARNYQIANFLVNSSTKNDKVFVWDPDSPAIYSLARRLPPIKYVVPYHVHDFSSREDEAINILSNPPKFIVLTRNYPYPELDMLIKNKYLLVNQIEDAAIYSRIDFAPER